MTISLARPELTISFDFTMTSSSASKRKRLGDYDETTSQSSQIAPGGEFKKPRQAGPSTKDRENASEEEDLDSDNNDIDEYTPGGKAKKTPRTSGGVNSGKKRKKGPAPGAGKPRPRLQNLKMAHDEEANEASISTPDPAYVTKGAHGRPLSRDQVRKANHSMIERRRREKMNTAFANLRGMVPGLNAEGDGIKGEFKLEVS